jgi:hypothetical protein
MISWDLTGGAKQDANDVTGMDTGTAGGAGMSGVFEPTFDGLPILAE